MDYSYLYGSIQFSEKMLKEIGFTKENDVYSYQKAINDHFYIILTVSKEQIFAKVFDLDFDEEYLPFSNKSSSGKMVSSIRKQVEGMVKELLKPCMIDHSMKEKVLTYVKEKYGTDPEYPWEDCNATLKTNNSHKWYGLLMDIPYSKLQKDSLNDSIIHAINIKCDKEMIQTLIDYQHFFPAYHMNKTYWITILLNQTLDESLLYKLIDQSYALVEKQKKPRFF